jgi:hypothetical protein
MAISFVAGSMLDSDLQRTTDLAFNTDLIYLDVVGNRVGINDSSPTQALTVYGNIAGNGILTINAISVSGNVVPTANLTHDLGQSTAWWNNVYANIFRGNSANIGQINAGNISATGNVSVVGNITAANFSGNATGNITAGGSNTQVQFNDNTLLNGTSGFTFNKTTNNVVVGGNVTANTAFYTGNITIPATGNIIAGNRYIASVLDPQQNQDAATKFYVDSEINTIGNIGNLTFSNTTIGTSLANANILIQASGTGVFVVDSTSGFVVPVGNIAQRAASPAQGTLRFDSSTNVLEVYDGAQWQAATNPTSVITNQTITPDGSTATFALNQSSSSDACLVSINGVLQTPSIDYSVVANSITFTSTPIVSDIVQVRFVASTTAISALALPNYTVAESANIAAPQTGQLIYATNGDSGNPCLAVYSSGAWKRIALGANISAT